MSASPALAASGASALSGMAHAKVTLSLRVLARRSDGYHELDALVATVDSPHDDIVLLADDAEHAGALVVEPHGAAPSGDENLVWRARAALGSTRGIRLHKAIPAEAGLGGGSADAAAMLRLLHDPGRVDAAALHAIAASLGADVPACLHGGLLRMRGVGERLEPLAASDAPTTALHLVLATPNFGCATAGVYTAWDTLGGPTSPRVCMPPAGWERAALDGAGHETSWRNDLEPAAIHVEPRLVAFRDALAEIARREPMLCGSGSTYFAVTATRAEAASIADAVRANLECRFVTAATVRNVADAVPGRGPASSR